MNKKIISLVLAVFMIVSVSVGTAVTASAELNAEQLFSLDVTGNTITVLLSSDKALAYEAYDLTKSSAKALATEVLNKAIDTVETAKGEKVIGASIGDNKLFELTQLNLITKTAKFEFYKDAVKDTILDEKMTLTEIANVSGDIFKTTECTIVFAGTGPSTYTLNIGFMGNTAAIKNRAAQLAEAFDISVKKIDGKKTVVATLDMPAIPDAIEKYLTANKVVGIEKKIEILKTLTVRNLIEKVQNSGYASEKVNSNLANKLIAKIPAAAMDKTLEQLGVEYVGDGVFAFNGTRTLRVGDYLSIESKSVTISGKKVSVDADGITDITITVPVKATVRLFNEADEAVASLGVMVNPAINAMRFGALYVKNNIPVPYTAEAITDIGMVMIPAFLLGNNELTINTESALYSSAIKIDTASYVSGNSFVDYDSFVFYVTLVGIPESARDTSIAYRPYYKFSDSSYIYGIKDAKSFNDAL